MRIMKKFLLLLSGFAFFSAFLSCQSGQEKVSNDRPNIILIFSDELQFQDISCLGGSIPTPNLDNLASEGMVFKNTYTTAPMCTPSRFSLLTGKFPGKCKHKTFIETNPYDEPYCIGWNTFIDRSVNTLPGLLSKGGYVTGMVGKWHLGEENIIQHGLKANDDPADPATDRKLKIYQQQLREKVKTDAGFDEVYSLLYGNYDNFPVHQLRLHNYPWLTYGAMQFIEKNAFGKKPFFLYLATSSVHGPNHAEGLKRDYRFTPEGYLEGLSAYKPDLAVLESEMQGMPTEKKHRFAGMKFMDHQLGMLTDKLEEYGISDNTVIVFLPDHNTEPAKATCYEKGIRIPMIITWPGRISPELTSAARIQMTDIFPTLLEIANIGRSEAVVTDGKSFLNLFNTPGAEFRELLFAESGYTRSVSDGRYKYIAFRYPQSILDKMKKGELNYAPNYVNKKFNGQSVIAYNYYPSYFDADQLFDLQMDPFEQNNLADNPQYSEVLEDMKNRLSEHLKEFEHPFDLSEEGLMAGETFKALVNESLKQKPEDIEWYARDWGKIVWPPDEQ